MSILVIRKHQRFAVIRKARLHCGEQVVPEGLLIEISLGGCRIGDVDASEFRMGQNVTMAIDGFGEMEGEVRWLGQRRIGLNLVRALHVHELDQLLRLCRGEVDRPAALSA